MAAVPSGSNNAPAWAKIEGSTNSGTWDVPLSALKSIKLAARFWHGAAMIVAFMGLMLPSAIYKRWKSNTVIHLLSHFIGLLVLAFGMVYGLPAFKSSGSSTGPHQVIGLVIICLIMLQFYLGVHIFSGNRISENASSFGPLHKWLGRLILALGISQIGFGLFITGVTSTGLLIWLLCALIESFVYWYSGPDIEPDIEMSRAKGQKGIDGSGLLE
ncbi:hypothetical protein BJ878DRAFT_141210 [Calycina marina]|uniref:Cytochrome b561 domain-containing protein n=1 Tax=Calycina marina TaxID=1763456 RepID=A0A9P7Z8W8_9HELO|nr:hypothetical protein BJ878DRAFT_141210 [Calycina marina]